MANKPLSQVLKERRIRSAYNSIRRMIIKENDAGRNELVVLDSRMDVYAFLKLGMDGITSDPFTEHGYKKVRLSWG